MKQKINDLAEAYLADLRVHLDDGQEASLAAADLLGRRARRLRLAPTELAQIHARSLLAVVSENVMTAGDERAVTRAGPFFFRVFAPLASALTATVPKSEVASHVKARKAVSSELTATKRKLKRETEKRQKAETALTLCRDNFTEMMRQSEQMQGQLRLLSRQILLAQEEERKSISRELHDEISQILTGINVQLAALTIEASSNTVNLKKKIASTQRLVKKSVDVVHRFARELRPAMLDDLGLVPTLLTMIKETRKRTGLNIRFTPPPAIEFDALASIKRTVLFRIAQESLINVAKHAKASSVSMILQVGDDVASMAIHDNGVGFDVNRALDLRRRKRLGIIGMRERAEMVGGTFEVTSAKGQGTTINVTLPINGSPV